MKTTQPLYIRGCYDAVGGYGSHIRSHLRILKASGIDFRLIYVPLDPIRTRSSEIDELKKLEVKEPAKDSVVINFCEAPYYQFYERCRHIGYSQWETDRLPNQSSSVSNPMAWVEILNRCDEVWTGSEFSRNVFIQSGVTKPVRQVPWPSPENFSINPDILEKLKFHTIQPWTPSNGLHQRVQSIYYSISKLPAWFAQPLISFCYLLFTLATAATPFAKAMMLSLKRDSLSNDTKKFRIVVVNTFNERKNYRDLIAAVFYTFKKSENVELLIKTGQAVDSWWMKVFILGTLQKWVDALKISDAPSVRVCLRPLSETDLNSFLNLGSVFLNTSKGEGIGGGVLLSRFLGLPVITHRFSAAGETFEEGKTYFYGHSLEPVVWNFGFYGDRQCWARPNMEDLSKCLREAYNDFLSGHSKPNLDSKSRAEKAKAESSRVLDSYQKLLK